MWVVHALRWLRWRRGEQCHHWCLTSEVSPAFLQNKMNQIFWQSREESSQKLAERKTKKLLHVANALQEDRQRALEHWLVVLTGAALELKGMTEARAHMKRKGSGSVGDVALDGLWTYTWWHLIFVTKPLETERVWFQGLHTVSNISNVGKIIKVKYIKFIIISLQQRW